MTQWLQDRLVSQKPRWSPQHPRVGSQLSLTSFSGSDALFWQNTHTHKTGSFTSLYELWVHGPRHCLLLCPLLKEKWEVSLVIEQSFSQWLRYWFSAKFSSLYYQKWKEMGLCGVGCVGSDVSTELHSRTVWGRGGRWRNSHGGPQKSVFESTEGLQESLWVQGQPGWRGKNMFKKKYALF